MRVKIQVAVTARPTSVRTTWVLRSAATEPASRRASVAAAAVLVPPEGALKAQVSPDQRKRHQVFVGVGANLGDARASVAKACEALGSLPGTRLIQASSLYQSKPHDANGPDFVNAVVEIETTLSPQNLLVQLQALEAGAKRQRPYRNAPRTLDLDILFYADLAINTPELVVPHPRMLERAFVLVPLAEIAPDRVSTGQLAAVSAQAVSRLG